MCVCFAKLNVLKVVITFIDDLDTSIRLVTFVNSRGDMLGLMGQPLSIHFNMFKVKVELCPNVMTAPLLHG